MKAKYQYNAQKTKAEILLIDDRDTCLVMTVSEAVDLISSLTGAIGMAFYDFTASTPNQGSPALRRDDD